MHLSPVAGNLVAARLAKAGMLALATTAASVALAAPVYELRPEELAAFVGGHELAVVQFTSPDPQCGFCVGADETFDQAAAVSEIRGLVFARVQWSPWVKIPNFEPITKIAGIPTQGIFRFGKVVRGIRGRPESGAALLEKIKTFLAAHPGGAPLSLTRDETNVARWWYRWWLLTSMTTECGRLMPAARAGYEERFKAWETTHEAAVDKAKRMFATGIRAESAGEERLWKDEQKTLRTWAVSQLKVSMEGFPNLDACDKISRNWASVPKLESPAEN